MSKRKRTSKIDKWIKEGRGSGIGSDYVPWLKIQDVSSLGRSTRLTEIKTNRQHEFLSDLERNHFYLTEHSDFIVDIREQFPLLPFMKHCKLSYVSLKEHIQIVNNIIGGYDKYSIFLNSNGNRTSCYSIKGFGKKYHINIKDKFLKVP